MCRFENDCGTNSGPGEEALEKQRECINLVDTSVLPMYIMTVSFF